MYVNFFRIKGILIALSLFATACPEDGEETGDLPEDGDDTGESTAPEDEDTSDEDSEEDPEQDTGSPAAGKPACEGDVRVGGFALFLAENYTSFQGSVADGVNPEDVAQELEEEGSCRLFAPNVLFCDPSCTALGETCGEGGFCIDTSLKQSVGAVTVEGMETPLEVEPNGLTLTYSQIVNDPYPGFVAGAEITLTAAGDDLEPFTLTASGVGQIESDETEILVERDSPTALTWEAPESEGSSRVHIKLDLTVHGTNMGWIECDVPDTGAFEIPADLVTGLIELGLGGFPNVIIQRRSVDTTQISPGCVELIVYSEVELSVQVPGLDSCNSDDDCEGDEQCQDDLTCG